MKLTPLDIRHKEFKRAMRGYADVEVDEFLDEVADEFERVFKENIDLRERVEGLEEQVANYRRMEEALQKTLISAQASADELKQSSAKEAQLIVHEGELQARQLVNEAYTERQGVEQATARLRSAEQDFRFKFKQLLQGYLNHMEHDSERIVPEAAEEPDKADFARQAEAVKQAIEREGAPATPEDAGLAAEPAAAEPPADDPAGEAAPAPDAKAPDTEEREPLLPSPDEVTAGHIAEYVPPADPPAAPGPGASAQAERERTPFGEDDDLLADVDSGVNENEFKW
jgi:cell division initiation protein